MKIKLSVLRKIIKEEVERNLRWSAGYIGGGISNPRKLNAISPVHMLGTEIENEDKELENYEKEEATDTNDPRERR